MDDKPQGHVPGRLTEFDRDEIRAAAAAGVTVKQLALEYRRRPATIRRILRPPIRPG